MATLTLNKTWIVLLLFTILLSSCNEHSENNKSQKESAQQSMNTEQTIVIDKTPTLRIYSEDGTEIPYAQGTDMGEPIGLTEQSIFYFDFSPQVPDQVTLELSPFYSGGSAWVLDSITIKPEKIDSSRYIFVVPFANEHLPAIFYFLRYTVTAQYKDSSHTYNFTIQAEHMPQKPAENAIDKVPDIIISYAQGQGRVVYTSAKNQWNGRAIKRECLFMPNRLERTFSHHHMMQDTEHIAVDFTPNQPDQIIVQEHTILMRNHEPYTGNTRSIAANQTANGIYEFEVKKPKDTNIGYVGYSITATWGKNICEYAFLFNPRVTDFDVEETAEISSLIWQKTR